MSQPTTQTTIKLQYIREINGTSQSKTKKQFVQRVLDELFWPWIQDGIAKRFFQKPFVFRSSCIKALTLCQNSVSSTLNIHTSVFFPF